MPEVSVPRDFTVHSDWSALSLCQRHVLTCSKLQTTELLTENKKKNPNEERLIIIMDGVTQLGMKAWVKDHQSHGYTAKNFHQRVTGSLICVKSDRLSDLCDM